MLDYTEGDVIVNDVKIHYYRTGGNRPPVVLLHGATDNGLCWTPVAGFLAKDYDVIMVDAQGHGLSDRLGDDFEFTDHAKQVAGLISELGIKKPYIMGHSMGAGTTVNIAVEYPDLPKAIILEDPAWRSEEDIAAENSEEMIKQREAFMQALAGYGKRTREELIAECRAMNPAWSEEEIIPWAEAKLQFDPKLFSLLQIDRPSYEELVPKIKCPVLLFTADGGIVSETTARHAVKLYQGSQPMRWVPVKGAGHNIRREQFETYRNAVLHFLKDSKD
jgi:N-formylmaleamate deformylase